MKNTFLITTLLATTALATSAWADTCTAESGNCGTNCTYSIDTNCHLIVQGPTTEGDTGSIRYGAFDNKSNITSAEIKGNITSIGENAFRDATRLTSVVIPDSITSINQCAFQGATSLTSITIPNSVKYIGSDAFYEATSLTSVTIPDSVTYFGSKVFSYASALTSVTIPDSVTYIGEDTFYQATSLTSVTIPDSVTGIDSRAFSFASALTSVTIPDSVTSIGDSAFLGISGNATVFCPSLSLCQGKGANAKIQIYTKYDNGVYEIGGHYYASLDEISQKVSCPGGTCTYQDGCGTGTGSASIPEACLQAVSDYKQQRAEKLAQNGVLCQTKTGCLNLMDMVSNDAYACTTIATCQPKAARYGVNLAAADPVPEPEVIPSGGTGGSDGQDTPKRRIYTLEEARQAVEAAGTDTVNFRIRYK